MTQFNLPVAIFGAIYEGDPVDLRGRVLIQETLYPPLGELARQLNISPKFMYDQLVNTGKIVILKDDELVIVTHAYTHDNNTTRTHQ